MTELGVAHLYEPGDDDAPVLVLLHGTGGDERGLLPLGRTLAPAAARLSLRGWVREADGAPRFFQRVPDPSPAANRAYPFTFDDADVSAQAARLRTIVEHARRDYQLGDRPAVAVGFSNGANLAAAALLLQPRLFRAAVLLAPMPVLSSPPEAELAETAAFLSGGRHDPVATPGGVERLAGWLSERGAAVDVHFHDGGHELTVESARAAREWLTKLQAGLGFGTASLP